MIGRDDDSTNWIVFVDALTERDIANANQNAAESERPIYLKRTHHGHVDSGVPRVTPRITGSFWTGADPAVHGMPTLQRYQAPDVQRPQQPTVMEQYSQQTDERVLSVHLPFTGGLQMGDGGAFMDAHLMGGAGGGVNMPGVPQQQQQQILNRIQIAPSTGDLIGPYEPEKAYHLSLDNIDQKFATVRQVAEEYDFDTVFLGFSRIDSYCHFQYNRPHDDPEFRYRDGLVRAVSDQLEAIADRNPLVWFSDHGATELEETFRINQWLAEHDWLEYTIDHDFAEKFAAVQQQGQQGQQLSQFPNNQRVENQLGVGSPAVTIDHEASRAVCADPFDAGITLLGEHVDADGLAAELMDTGHFRDVYERADVYDEQGGFYEQCPDIVPDRAEGVFVSGNLHPDAVGMGYYREGVHFRRGVIGGGHSFESDMYLPEQIYDMLCRFLSFDPVANPEYEQMGTQQLLEQKREFERQANEIDQYLGGEA